MNLKEKLGSRKLWVTVINDIALVGAAFGLTDSTIAHVTAIIMAAGITMTYLFGQSSVDRAKAEHSEETDDDVNDFFEIVSIEVLRRLKEEGKLK